MMRESRKSLKLKARRALLGRYPAAVGMFILTEILCILFLAVMELGGVIILAILSPVLNEEMGFLTFLGFFGVLMVIFLWFFCLVLPGYCRFYLNICLGREGGVSDIFRGFAEGRFWGIGLVISLIFGLLITPDIVLTSVMVTMDEVFFPLIFMSVYNLCLMIAGLYVSFTYGQFYLILADNPGMALGEALKESRRLMRGSRFRLFVLGLSFLGWFALAYITFGLSILWLVPYMMTTNVYFYLNLKEIHRE
ncbi:MAG: DUF975 family protein [Hungatella sp.]|nr:DUF975 family protein [Hungatella sp.]